MSSVLFKNDFFDENNKSLLFLVLRSIITNNFDKFRSKTVKTTIDFHDCQRYNLDGIY